MKLTDVFCINQDAGQISGFVFCEVKTRTTPPPHDLAVVDYKKLIVDSQAEHPEILFFVSEHLWAEGQYELSGSYLDQLNEIDNKLVEVVEQENESEFARLLKSMLDLVRENGKEVPVDELVESDVVLPEPDITLLEAEGMFTGEGLVPG